MADPKYAGLPGIVYDQPDVYETSDLPEAEQDFTEPGDISDAIETLHISAEDAHDRFKGKILDGSKVDFSDRISRQRRTGYDVRHGEWELVGEGEKETVVQKYQRLQCEVTQLQEELQNVKGTLSSGNEKISAVHLASQADTLHQTLVNLHLEETLGSDTIASISQPQAALLKKLVNLLESFKKTGLVNEKGEKLKGSGQAPVGTSSDSNGGITYELYYAPEHAKLNELAQAADMEKRIDRLESLLGNNPDKLSSLSAATNHKSIVGAIGVLSGRMSLLDPAHLDHVEGRLHAVHTRMNQISEKKTAIEEADKQSKINELYDLVKNSEALCCALPEVLDRLVSIEALHDQAMQFSKSLKQLDVAQTQLTSSLQTNSDLLNAVQEKFTQNLNIIQNNMANLDTRIQTLQK
ncbi:dynactin subunit 2 [Oratosquilla oratoria]|uniref:dynactin subunit 2 n=1 Tax=Oratosquilla oratoria TaxID=337810 RepID=UPI003F768849